MDVIMDRCAGLDIGKDKIVACARTPAKSGRGRSSELRTFRTFTSGIEELADWLTANGVSKGRDGSDRAVLETCRAPRGAVLTVRG